MGEHVRRPRRLQHERERAEQQLGHAGRRRGALHERRHLGGPHPRHGAGHAPELRPERRAERRPALLQPRDGAPAHPRRDPAPQVRGGWRADPRSRGESRYELPRAHSGGHAVHVPDARSERDGAEHGADVAPGASRRSALRLRRLPRAQPDAARLPHDRGGVGIVRRDRARHGGAAHHARYGRRAGAPHGRHAGRRRRVLSRRPPVARAELRAVSHEERSDAARQSRSRRHHRVRRRAAG